MRVVGPQAARSESYVQLHGMGFYMDESDEGPATGGIARGLVPKQEAKKNALAALVTDVEQWGGHLVAHDRVKTNSLASGSVHRHTEVDVREGFAPST